MDGNPDSTSRRRARRIHRRAQNRVIDQRSKHTRGRSRNHPSTRAPRSVVKPDACCASARRSCCAPPRSSSVARRAALLLVAPSVTRFGKRVLLAGGAGQRQPRSGVDQPAQLSVVAWSSAIRSSTSGSAPIAERARATSSAWSSSARPVPAAACGQNRAAGGDGSSRLLSPPGAPGAGDRFGEQGALPVLYAAVAEIPGDSFTGPRHLMHMRGAPELIKRSTRASDSEVARRLWSLSEELTGTHFPTRRSERTQLSDRFGARNPETALMVSTTGATGLPLLARVALQLTSRARQDHCGSRASRGGPANRRRFPIGVGGCHR